MSFHLECRTKDDKYDYVFGDWFWHGGIKINGFDPHKSNTVKYLHSIGIYTPLYADDSRAYDDQELTHEEFVLFLSFYCADVLIDDCFDVTRANNGNLSQMWTYIEDPFLQKMINSKQPILISWG